MTSNPAGPQAEFGRVVRTLKKSLPLILGVAALAFVVVWLWGSAQPSLYDASAAIHVRPTDPDTDEEIADRRVADAAFQLESAAIRDPVITALGIDVDAIERVSVIPLTGQDTVQVTVVATDPEVAAAAANAHIEIYQELASTRSAAMINDQAEHLRGQAEALDEQLATLRAELAAAEEDSTEALALDSDIQELEDRQIAFRSIANGLEADAALEGSSATVASSANPPQRPFAPQPLRNATIAVILALVIAPGVVLIWEWLSGRVSDAGEVSLLVPDIPVLGKIPATGKRKPFRLKRALPDGPRTLSPPDSAAGEAYRTLSTSLRFSRLAKTTQRIAVTSPVVGDGKSTVTANLAAALAASGLRVVVVEADLRRPSLGELLDVPDDVPGLTSVLLGEASVGECLTPTKAAGGAALGYLPPGPLPANPPALLGSDAFGRLLDRIDEAGVDVILLDCPPVLSVSDALVAAQDVDGVILVVAVNQTKKAQLLETVQRLHEVEAKIVGVVVNGVEPDKVRYYDDYKPPQPDPRPAVADKLPPPPVPANENGHTKSGTNGGPTTAERSEASPADQVGSTGPTTPPRD